jgi:transcriptional regulator with PAS, ATPase and Fis domain
VKQNKVDVRIIAATNKNLVDEVKAKHFREDLYYRMNVINIKVPPLRERKSDIPLLVKYYLDKRRIRRNREIHVSKETMALLVNHDWPGNIRELFNAIEYALTISNKDSIEIEDLPINIIRHQRIGASNEWMNLKEVEKEHIAKVLSAQGGNLQRTAKILNISRPTLYKKLRRYRITN